MKNRSIKTILVFFALGLISCAFCVQQAQAVPITGSITFAGGVHLNNTTVNLASMVTSWLDEGGNMPTVQSVSGTFASFVTAGQTATFAFPWSFNSGPLAAFWTVGGFTFNLVASHIVFQGGGFVSVSGQGTVTGNGFDATGIYWNFSAQDPGSDGVFSFSGANQTPDDGATVALLGVALAGIEGIRRKLLRRPKN
jgi:hypothetical protein